MFGCLPAVSRFAVGVRFVVKERKARHEAEHRDATADGAAVATLFLRQSRP